MKKFIKTHKAETIIASICLLMVIFILIFIKIFFLADSGDNYAGRLDGIEKVKINNDKLEKIKTEIKKENGIISTDSNLEGRIINFLITVESDQNIDNMKSKAIIIMDNLSNKEKEFYDIQIYLVTKEKSEIYPNIGYQSKGSSNIVWVR